jgi:vacuolar-type H+-ATPase subunit F/Vma7
MTGIALIAEKNTAKVFRLAGLTNVHSVEDSKGAKKCLQTILKKNDLKIILVSERLLSKIQILEEIAERKSPSIIPIPDLQIPMICKTNLIVELIKRKTGIEVKI